MGSAVSLLQEAPSFTKEEERRCETGVEDRKFVPVTDVLAVEVW